MLLCIIDIQHWQVLRLLGVCTQAEPILIVTEFMANGAVLPCLVPCSAVSIMQCHPELQEIL